MDTNVQIPKKGIQLTNRCIRDDEYEERMRKLEADIIKTRESQREQVSRDVYEGRQCEWHRPYASLPTFVHCHGESSQELRATEQFFQDHFDKYRPLLDYTQPFVGGDALTWLRVRTDFERRLKRATANETLTVGLKWAYMCATLDAMECVSPGKYKLAPIALVQCHDLAKLYNTSSLANLHEGLDIIKSTTPV